MNFPRNTHTGFRCPLPTKQWAGGLIGGLLFVMSAHISDQIIVRAAAKGTPVTNAYGGLAANIGKQDIPTKNKPRVWVHSVSVGERIDVYAARSIEYHRYPAK